MLARNRHSAHVAGLAPGAVGDVPEETVSRYPWALRAVRPGAQEAAGDDGDGMTAREARKAIQESEDPEFVRQFFGDSRSSVHSAAVRRLRQLRETEKE